MPPLAIVVLIALCLWLFNLNQDARYEAKETQLIHEKLIAEAKANNANIIFQILFIFDAKSLVKIMQQRYALERLNQEIDYLGLMFICNQNNVVIMKII